MFNALNVVMIGIYILVIPIILHSAKQFIELVEMVSEDTEEW